MRCVLKALLIIGSRLSVHERTQTKFVKQKCRNVFLKTHLLEMRVLVLLALVSYAFGATFVIKVGATNSVSFAPTAVTIALVSCCVCFL
jgi:hypothetical protein